MKKNTVKIMHPATQVVGSCLESAVKAWVRQGWVVVNDGKNKVAEPVIEESSVDAPRDVTNGLSRFLMRKPDNNNMMELVQDIEPDKDLEE